MNFVDHTIVKNAILCVINRIWIEKTPNCISGIIFMNKKCNYSIYIYIYSERASNQWQSIYAYTIIHRKPINSTVVGSSTLKWLIKIVPQLIMPPRASLNYKTRWAGVFLIKACM